MKLPLSRGLSEPTRRRIELAVAVAQERLFATHVDHALDLIELVDEQVSFADALEIYSRLLRLDEDEARNISTRALATLGQRGQDAAPWPDEQQADELDEESDERGFFGQLKQRLRGRVNEELRRRIELSAARTEVAILRTHVDNAINFVEILRKDEEMDEKAAIELYLDALDVRESVAEITYYLALARIADDELPEEGAGVAAARERGVVAENQEARGQARGLHVRGGGGV